MKRLIVLVGASGTGKSAVRQLLAERRPDLVTFGIDDFPDWRTLVGQIEKVSEHQVVVECCRIPRALYPVIEKRRGVVAQLTVPPALRRSRLIARGESPIDVEKRMAEDDAISYDGLHPEPALCISNGSDDPGDAAGALSAFCDVVASR